MDHAIISDTICILGIRLEYHAINYFTKPKKFITSEPLSPNYHSFQKKCMEMHELGLRRYLEWILW